MAGLYYYLKATFGIINVIIDIMFSFDCKMFVALPQSHFCRATKAQGTAQVRLEGNLEIVKSRFGHLRKVLINLVSVTGTLIVIVT